MCVVHGFITNSDLAALKLGLLQLDVDLFPISFADFVKSLKLSEDSEGGGEG